MVGKTSRFVFAIRILGINDMQIKRELELTVTKSRRFVINQTPPTNNVFACARCGDPMVAIEHAARLLRVNQRRIFQIIETGTVHFFETESGGAIVCVTSLAAVLDVELEEQL